jgi:hypothetical protein
MAVTLVTSKPSTRTFVVTAIRYEESDASD